MLEIYTDGSCHPNPGPGAWAFVVYENGREIHSASGAERATTNNRMEITAIIEAFRWLEGRHAVVHSDSEYCVKALTQWWRKWERNGWRKGKTAESAPVKNAELWREALAHMGSARLKWVRGHAGLRGNERADQLALSARVHAAA